MLLIFILLHLTPASASSRPAPLCAARFRTSAVARACRTCASARTIARAALSITSGLIFT